MHTFKGNETVFIAHGDLSGDVTIKRGKKEIDIPGVDLIAFIAEHVRNEKISRLEQAEDMEVLMGDF